MKTFSPTPNFPPNLSGLDFEIYTIQSYLCQLPFLEQCFGLAHIQQRIKSESESITTEREGYRGTARYVSYYPQGIDYGIGGLGTDVDLTFDDKYASRVFFINQDKADTNIKVDKWDWTSREVLIEQPVGLIFHCNLQSLEISSSEYIKTQILQELMNCPKVVGTRIFEDMQSVWKEFTITPEMNGITRYPNYCLRIDLLITYLAFPYNQ